MAENLAQRLNDNFLQCSICSEKLDNPRMLPCVHTFCFQCLVRWEDSIRGQDFRCPFCQSHVDLPDAGVRGLPANFILVNLMEELQLAEYRTDGVSPVCGFCKREDGRLFCLDCKLHLCKPCEETHKRLPGFNDHTVIEADKLSDEKYMKNVIAKKPPKCTEHPQEDMKFYCKTCQSPACLHCTVVNHRGHECVDVRDWASKVKGELHTLSKRSQGQVKIFSELMDDVSSSIVRKQEDIATCKRQVNDHFERFVTRLKSDRDELLREIEETGKLTCNPMIDISDQIQEWMQQVDDVQTTFQRVLEDDNHWEISETKVPITLQFEELSRSGGNLFRQGQRERRRATKVRQLFSVTTLTLPEKERHGEGDMKVHPDCNMVGRVGNLREPLAPTSLSLLANPLRKQKWMW